MLQEEDLHRIERYLEGCANDEEKKHVESLFANGQDNQDLRSFLSKEWDVFLETGVHSDANLENLLDRIHYDIKKNGISKSQRLFTRFYRFYRSTAAILLIPLVLTVVMMYKHFEVNAKEDAEREAHSTIYAPMCSRVSFDLPDGTTGMLNSGSKLSYSLPFTTKRQVELEGEAWFEVTHNEQLPFEIVAGSSTINVLGTSFNVSAYPKGDYIEVVLLNGKVEFKDNKINEGVIIYPSERLVLQNGKISKSIVDVLKYNAWTEGWLVFKGDTMSEVARRIERWYDVEIIFSDKELESYTFRGTFHNDKLEDVLRYLAMTSPIRYKISPGVMMPDGTYKKEKVTIYKK